MRNIYEEKFGSWGQAPKFIGQVRGKCRGGCALNLQFQFENNKLSPSIKSCARKAARLSYPRRCLCLHCCPSFLAISPIAHSFVPLSHRPFGYSVIRALFMRCSRGEVLHYAGDSIACEKGEPAERPA